VTFAVATGRRLAAHRGGETARSASVVKAMLLVAYLRRPDVRSRPLRRGERALLSPMIRVSDNRAATRVQARVGTTALVALARAAGMRRFVPSRTWGGSGIDAADQARFFLRLEALLPARHRATALRWLQTVVPRQRWGIAPVTPAGWTPYFKGGWGSGRGAVTHQVALLARGEQRVAIAILTTANPSHAYGRVTVEGVARALVAGLESAPPA
jgi:beta-lactamase class A